MFLGVKTIDEVVASGEQFIYKVNDLEELKDVLSYLHIKGFKSAVGSELGTRDYYESTIRLLELRKNDLVLLFFGGKKRIARGRFETAKDFCNSEGDYYIACVEDSNVVMF